MPLLEIGDDKPLSQKFSFLNIAPQEDNRELTSVKQVDESLPRVQSLEPKVSKDTSEVVSDQAIDVQDMQAVGVVKTTTGASKLFINLATPARPLGKRIVDNHRFLFSPLYNDTDKSGASCSVITVLDLKGRINLDMSSDVLSLLDYVRESSLLDLSNKYTLPRMRRKGRLAKVLPARRPIDTAKVHESEVPNQSSAKVSKITELNSVENESENISTSSSTVKHTTTRLSVAAQALPLPTRYSHHFSILLPTSDREASWSVYFDGQDSTLKILLPPQEDFITLKARLDDFRAFTKDGELHIFFIGQV
ncbi:protein of unknown function [Taphrina deformans PYCC 5710]|uniref:Uncharacterized protein n=1 Tax=Taphrina deformans (strain PYCC 5710 / ATCC 11124 / CBS 356.35 / IMI 108563 / JCM 9778 / NBRC 8474) TaxID=1097556 RepID=R4XCK4_TAPDE|nr:protein of unknown function [Taphrina deformans PYCC 5710]|eukprot:CCG82096.1 protein of unknown function [Taphrina deformans PYCC 5710]